MGVPYFSTDEHRFALREGIEAGPVWGMLPAG
jgi:hypothetical protein